MNADMKRRIEMAGRVLVYSREHPSDAAGYQAAVARLVERLARAETVTQLHATNRLLSKGGLAERRALRRTLTADLRLLAAIARSAGLESVGTPVVIQYPGPGQSNLAFLEGGRAAVSLGREQEELLVRHGLPAAHLGELAVGLDAFEARLIERDLTLVKRIDARAELKQVGRDLARVADELGAFNRHRFQDDPVALSAWRFARSPRTPARKVAEPVKEENGLPALPPGSGSSGTLH